MSGHLDDTAILPRGMSSTYSLNRRLFGLHSRAGCDDEEETESYTENNANV
jgi:hypothetical protein